MNIALSTLVIFLILLPGIIYRRFYYTEEFSQQYFKQSIFGVFISSVVPAFVLHTLWYFLVPLFSSVHVDMAVLGYLFSTGDKLFLAFENIQKYDLQIFIYQISIFIFASLIGLLSKYLVRVTKLDRRRKLFRFQNSWHYLFTGEFFDFPKASFDLELDDVKHIEYVYVDALVEIKEGSIIYEGILVDYELSREGGLEYLILKETIRRFLVEDDKSRLLYKDENTRIDSLESPDTAIEGILPETQDFHIQIHGHIVVIPYRDVKNINFSYFKVVEISPGVYDVKNVA